MNGPSGMPDSVFIARCVTTSVLWMSSPSRSDTMLAAFSISSLARLATPCATSVMSGAREPVIPRARARAAGAARGVLAARAGFELDKLGAKQIQGADRGAGVDVRRHVALQLQ